MKMMNRTLLTLAVALLAAAAHAAPCAQDQLSSVVAPVTSNIAQCTKETGYDLMKLEMPAVDQLAKVKTNANCQSTLAKIYASAPGCDVQVSGTRFPFKDAVSLLLADGSSNNIKPFTNSTGATNATTPVVSGNNTTQPNATTASNSTKLPVTPKVSGNSTTNSTNSSDLLVAGAPSHHNTSSSQSDSGSGSFEIMLDSTQKPVVKNSTSSTNSKSSGTSHSSFMSSWTLLVVLLSLVGSVVTP